MMPARRAIAALALLALAAPPLPAAAADKEPAPAFIPELQPLAGTWKRIKREKKEPDIFLVIKDEQGKLRLRYQLPTRKKVYTSDWNGDIELNLSVNMKEIHDLELTPAADPARIDVVERIRYTGTWKGPAPYLEASYSLSADGKLLYRCRRFMQDEKEYPCPQPVEYERVSTLPKWD